MNVILKEIRKVHNLTQTQLAKKLGVSRSAIAQIEGGINNLSLDLAKKISTTFLIPLEEVLSDKEEIAWTVLENSEKEWSDTYYGENSIISLRFDEVEYLRLLIDKIAEEKNIKIFTRRFEEFCEEYDYYSLKEKFLANRKNQYNDKALSEMFKIVDMAILKVKNDLCSMLIFEYDILKEYYLKKDEE